MHTEPAMSAAVPSACQLGNCIPGRSSSNPGVSPEPIIKPRLSRSPKRLVIFGLDASQLHSCLLTRGPIFMQYPAEEQMTIQLQQGPRR